MTDIVAFVKHIEYTLFDAVDELEPDVIQTVVQFNIRRKQLLEQLVALLNSHRMRLGEIFAACTGYMGMYDSFVDEEPGRKCYVSGVVCTKGRFVVFCEKIHRNGPNPSSFSFFVRSDIYKFVRFFYFIQHFNFFVSRVIITPHELLDDLHMADSPLVLDIAQKYNHASKHLMNLVLLLEQHT
tara:strand:- start:6472 stop:7020 length:549 start_codon:yes stop_codon:yes gene_type:complete